MLLLLLLLLFELPLTFFFEPAIVVLIVMPPLALASLVAVPSEADPAFDSVTFFLPAAGFEGRCSAVSVLSGTVAASDGTVAAEAVSDRHASAALRVCCAACLARLVTASFGKATGVEDPGTADDDVEVVSDSA